MTVATMPQRQLPLFEGHTIEMAKITFAGGVEFGLTAPRDQALVEALRLGKPVEITVECGGQLVRLEGKVDVRSFGFKADKDMGDIPQTTCKIKVLDAEPER